MDYNQLQVKSKKNLPVKWLHVAAESFCPDTQTIESHHKPPATSLSTAGEGEYNKNDSIQQKAGEESL